MAYYLSKFLTRLAEETKSEKELLVNLIAANFPVERANRLIIIIIFFFTENPTVWAWPVKQSCDQMWSCYKPGKIIYGSRKLENVI